MAVTVISERRHTLACDLERPVFKASVKTEERPAEIMNRFYETLCAEAERYVAECRAGGRRVRYLVRYTYEERGDRFALACELSLREGGRTLAARRLLHVWREGALISHRTESGENGSKYRHIPQENS